MFPTLLVHPSRLCLWERPWRPPCLQRHTPASWLCPGDRPGMARPRQHTISLLGYLRALSLCYEPSVVHPTEALPGPCRTGSCGFAGAPQAGPRENRETLYRLPRIQVTLGEGAGGDSQRGTDGYGIIKIQLCSLAKLGTRGGGSHAGVGFFCHRWDSENSLTRRCCLAGCQGAASAGSPCTAHP